MLKCPCCGHVVLRRALTRGALGHPIQALTKYMVGKGNGPGGAGIVWTRRPMQPDELQEVGRAVAKAAEIVSYHIGEDRLSIVDPETTLSDIDDVDDLAKVADEWVEEAKRELEYRLQIVENEYNRRKDQ